MNRDSLEQLLRDADDDATTLPDAALADRVRQVAARRAVRARLAAGGLVTGCLVALVVWIVKPESDVRPVSPRVVVETIKPVAPVPDLRAEVIALRDEADRAAALAEQLWAAERRAQPRRVMHRASMLATTDVAAQVERAAFTMVYQAGRMPTARGGASPAADVYRQVAQSFPHTRSGEVARQRLSELQNRKDG